MTTPRSLVTGGAGFLGSHLCERLLAEGHEVICMDNLLTGNAENVSHLLSDQFQLIECNVTRFLAVPGKLDFIFHFASPASPIDYLEYPIQTLKVGALGTLNALGLAKTKDATFLLASTSEVYGDPLVHPQNEDYWGNVNPIGPRGVYDEAKRYAEALVMAYYRFHSLKTRIVRIFNTYGPRMRILDGRAIPTFLAQALRKEPLTVFGDGSQTRSFCHISDLIEGIIRLSRSDFAGPVNIGNPNEITVLELAQTIIEQTGSRSVIDFRPLPVGDPKVRQPDISLAKEILDWEPSVALREGLKDTLKYFQQKLAA